LAHSAPCVVGVPARQMCSLRLKVALELGSEPLERDFFISEVESLLVAVGVFNHANLCLHLLDSAIANVRFPPLLLRLF
jgi:hypothetical protein